MAMIRLIFIFIIPIFIISGCAKKKPELESSLRGKCFEGAPKWVINPEIAGDLSAVGSAKVGKAGIQFAKTEATALARDEIARIMGVKVKNMVRNFVQVTGVGDNETVDRVSKQVSTQVANQLLVGSKAKAQWLSPCNELFVLVTLDPKEAGRAVKEAVITSYKNQQALWQMFQAKKAWEELERQVEKEFGSWK